MNTPAQATASEHILEGNTRRAIDIPQGTEVDAAAFKALVRAAVTLNATGKARATKKASPGGG